MNQKGQVSLNIVKAAMILFLVIAIIGVSLILITHNLTTVADTIDTTTTTIVNVTTTGNVNESGAYISGTESLRNCVLTVTSVINQTDLSDINSGNYTVSACKIAFTGVTTDFNNTMWNVSGSYTYSEDRAYSIQQNITTGSAELFENTGTIFAILAVVIIIYAIAIIITIVRRFGDGATGL